MNSILVTLFSPILNVFERGEGAYGYKSSHRKILIAVGCLFLLLSGVSLYFSLLTQEFGALLPFAVFLLASLVCLVVALLGSDRAVANIWGSK